MKKIAGKIAMILILVMLANSFAGCTLFLPQMFAKSVLGEWGYGALGLLIDCLILALLIMSGRSAEAPNEAETGIYLAGAADNQLPDYYSAREKLNSLPETERASLMEKINSLPEAKRAALIKAVNSLPGSEISASIERVNAVPDTKFASTVREFSSLSETDLNIVIDELRKRAVSQSETNAVAAVGYPPVYAYAALRLQY